MVAWMPPLDCDIMQEIEVKRPLYNLAGFRDPLVLMVSYDRAAE